MNNTLRSYSFRHVNEAHVSGSLYDHHLELDCDYCIKRLLTFQELIRVHENCLNLLLKTKDLREVAAFNRIR